MPGRALVTGLLVVTVTVVTACADRTEGRFGADLFEVSCAGCHRGDGSGGRGPALDAGSEAVSLSDGEIADVIRVGPGSMPSFSRLSDDQVASLVAHIRELQSS